MSAVGSGLLGARSKDKLRVEYWVTEQPYLQSFKMATPEE